MTKVKEKEATCSLPHMLVPPFSIPMTPAIRDSTAGVVLLVNTTRKRYTTYKNGDKNICEANNFASVVFDVKDFIIRSSVARS